MTGSSFIRLTLDQLLSHFLHTLLSCQVADRLSCFRLLDHISPSPHPLFTGQSIYRPVFENVDDHGALMMVAFYSAFMTFMGRQFITLWGPSTGRNVEWLHRVASAVGEMA